MQLEQRSQQHIHQLAMDLAGQLAHTEQQAAIHAANLKDAITASQGNIESSQNQGFKNWKISSKWPQLDCIRSAKICVARSVVSWQTNRPRASALLCACGTAELTQPRTQSAVGKRLSATWRRVPCKDVTTYTIHGSLANLLCRSRNPGHKNSGQHTGRLGEQMQSALLPLRKWIMASVCSGDSLAAVVAIAARAL